MRVGNRALRSLAMAAALAASIDNVGAESFPARPLTMIVPLAAGGPTDTLARIVAEGMARSLGQPVIVENVTGAAGTIGVGRAVHAAADGYTISIGNWFTHVLNGATYSLSYDLLTDFAPVALLADNPLLIVGRKGLPAKDLKQLIAWLKQNPDSATEGTSGVGSASHVGGLLFQKLSGTQFRFVPYRGAAPAMQDLVAGRIDLMFDQVSSSLPYVRGEQIAAYAVTAKNRSPIAPEILTVDEAGLPDFHLSIWHALWVPKGTPSDVVVRLNAAAVEALANPTVRERLAALGHGIRPLDQQTPVALAAFQRAEIEKWWPVVKAAGIKAD
jgi:tripartite-type tricarboxylate transporter receptor subunit TctC